jgi:hypothetical protein
MTKPVMTFVATLAMVAHAAGPTTLPLKDFDQPIALVDGKVVDVSLDQSYGHRITLQVVHVYFGSFISKGQSFFAASNREDMHGRTIWPPPPVGEEGLWIVGNNDGKFYTLNRWGAFHFYFPWRIDANPEKWLPRYHAFGEAIEAVSHADHDTGIKLLRDELASPFPEVSAWAILSLGEVSPQDVIALSHNVVKNTDLGIAGQAAVDQAMVEIDEEHWLKSNDRTALLHSWAESKPDEYDQAIICERLNVFSQETIPDDRILFETIAAIEKNRSFTIMWRRWMDEVMRRRADRDGKDSLAAQIFDTMPGVSSK